MQGRATHVFVIIPFYNETRVLPETLASVLALGYHVVAVDDGSTDDSYRIAAELPVHLLRHAVNLGQGAALATGIEYALGQGADFIVTFDADGQHDASDIASLLAPLLQDTADVVLGSRFMNTASTMPPSRRLLLKLAMLYTRMTTGVWFSDVHNGLRAFTARAARMITIRQNRMAHASEILSEIIRLRLRYVFVPVRVVYTDYSQRKGQRTLDAISILMDLFEGKLQ